MLLSLFLSLFCLGSHPAYATTTAAPKLVILGDSLAEGYGVAKEKAFPGLLQKKLSQAGYKIEVMNAGVSGSTSASALARLRWIAKSKPAMVFLELGANDGLRGLSVTQMEKNLSDAIEFAKAQKIKVFLAGMQMPPNYSDKYTRDFREVFPRLAKKHSVPLMPFLLEGVAGQSKLNLADGIHPNEKGHEIIAENVFQFLKGHL